jgi:hypothetical protein
MSRPNTKERDNAIDILLAEAVQDYRRLREELNEKVALIRALRKMRGTSGGEQLELVGKKEQNGDAWPARVDAVLRERAGKKASPREIVETLGGKSNRFPGIKTPADILIRGYLRRYQGKYGWKMMKRGHKVLWWKEPGTA